MSRPISGTGLIIAAGVLWGTGGIAARLAMGEEGIGPLLVAWVRLFGAGLALAVVSLVVQRRHVFSIGGAAGMKRLVLLAVPMALYQVFIYRGPEAAGVTIPVVLALALSPVIIATLAWPLLGERPTLALAGAGASAVLGTLLVMTGKAPSAQPIDATAGALYGMLAAASYSTFVVYSRRFAAAWPPMKTVALVFGSSALLLAPFAVDAFAAAAWSPRAIASLAYLALIATGLAYTLYFHGIVSSSANAAAIASFAEPLTAAVLASAIFAESLSGPASAGILLLLAGMIAVAWSQPKQRRRSD